MSNALLRLPVTATFADPTADATYVVARVPEGAGKMTLVGASAVLDATVASDATNYVGLTLKKVGVDGAATAVALTAALGGASHLWTADRPQEFVMSTVEGACQLLEGEYITCVYDENGTVAPGLLGVFLELAPGVA